MAVNLPSGFICRSCARPSQPLGLHGGRRVFQLTSQPARYYSAGVEQQDAPTQQLTSLVFPSITAPTYPVLPDHLPPSVSARERRQLRTKRAPSWEDAPYQCFQEARKIIAADRAEKLQQLELERKRLAKAKEALLSSTEDRPLLEKRVRGIENYIEKLKIYADINDPAVKRAFEDGRGTMDKPIYRYLSRRAWELTTLPILTQRLTQMHVIPDLLPHLKPVTGSTLSWNSTPIEPGAFVRSSTSAVPPTLQITSFAQAPRLLSIVVTDPDVPDLQRDGFTEQVLYYAANIEVDAFSGAIELADPAPGTEAEVLIEWTPPVVQKGSPYHRLCVLVLEQQDGVIRRAEALEKLWGGSGAEQGTAGKDGAGSPTAAPRATFAMCRAVTPSRPIGANLFRAVWDEDTEAVMRSIGSDLINTELRRERFYSPAKARVIERRKENMKR